MVLDHEHDGDLALDRGAVAMLVPTTDVPVRGVRIDVDKLCRRVRVRHRGALTLLDSASFTVAAGELVAIIGPSGAGKTTLLETIAGIGPTTSGSVRFDGIDLHANLGAFRSVLGYVPQDDIVHAELPLRRMLRYAARLRLPSSTSATEVDEVVSDAIDAVGLTGQVDVEVGSLSGGQRKRASIAVELLTDPHVFFLDEPTSGLDPITGAELVSRLRDLADRSATVLFTTHSVEDVVHCDRIVCMAPGGRIAFVGPVADALGSVRRELRHGPLPCPRRTRWNRRHRARLRRCRALPLAPMPSRSHDRSRPRRRNGRYSPSGRWRRWCATA